MYSYRETICRIKRENGELETTLREAGVFFSRRVKKEPKKASAPRRPTGNAQSLILYPRKEVLAEVILRRELCLGFSFVIGSLWQKKCVYVEERRSGGRISQKALHNPFPQQQADFWRRGDGLFLDKVTQTDQYRQLKASCLHLPWVWRNIAFFDEVCERERSECVTPLHWRSILPRVFFIRALDSSLYRENRGSREVLADHNSRIPHVFHPNLRKIH